MYIYILCILGVVTINLTINKKLNSIKLNVLQVHLLTNLLYFSQDAGKNKKMNRRVLDYILPGDQLCKHTSMKKCLVQLMSASC